MNRTIRHPNDPIGPTSEDLYLLDACSEHSLESSSRYFSTVSWPGHEHTSHLPLAVRNCQGEGRDYDCSEPFTWLTWYMNGRDLGLAAVARLAGVSTATVSNTINRPHIVSPTTRNKVFDAIAELNFVPNRAAAALRQGTNRVLGLVIPEITNPFYAAIVDAVSDAADKNHYSLTLCVSHDNAEREWRNLESLAEQRAAGALIVPITADSSRLSRLQMVGTRLVIVDRIADVAENCSVAVDDVRGGEIAIEHLLGCKGEGMSIVNGSLSITQCRDRREGARRALSKVGFNPDGLREFQVEEMTIQAGVDAGRRLANSPGIHRVFCTNDQLAVGVIRGLRLEGIMVPENMSVVGYGDLGINDASSVRLTSVGQPQREMGERAVGKLLEELTDGIAHKHSTTLLEPQLVLNNSTATN